MASESHFFPKLSTNHDVFVDDRSLIQFSKAHISMEINQAARCMDRCKVAFDSDKLSEGEQLCLANCSTKFFDAGLFLTKEKDLYTTNLLNVWATAIIYILLKSIVNVLFTQKYLNISIR